jgi:HAD superfamily hydrolase (TIGR01509 family)
MGLVAVGRIRAADLDAVVIDAYGTLMTLIDPTAALVDVLSEHGLRRPVEVVRAGVEAEIAYYAPRASEGRDAQSLAQLQRECARVFLEAVDGELDPGDFAPIYARALRFRELPGVKSSLEHLRALGLTLAVVGNWDLTLRDRLAEVGLERYFDCILHAAGKPAPDGLQRALAELAVEPQRALYIGDTADDERAARAAGMQFAPAPVPAAVDLLG